MKAFDARRLLKDDDHEPDADLVSELREVCRTKGFFQLTNAGVLFDDRRDDESSLVAAAVDATKALFALPEGTYVSIDRSIDRSWPTLYCPSWARNGFQLGSSFAQMGANVGHKMLRMRGGRVCNIFGAQVEAETGSS